ncbi:hypothetical protein [Halalkalicoccus salilacus]|uniref:hypothetical protein n=1 Tax=Halalkalicoccus salilacus TaxID=3117459 RepID=UPI00300EE952
MNPRHVDAIVDLTYGVLIFVSILSIILIGTEIGFAFGFGVLISYAVHVTWKMARFDPDWMTTAVEEAVEQTVEETVEETVNEQIGTIQDQLETINQRVERRPREDEIEAMIEETAERDRQGRSNR